MPERSRPTQTSSPPRPRWRAFEALLAVIQRFFGDHSAAFASHCVTIRDKDAPLPVLLEPSGNDRLVDVARDCICLNFARELSLAELARQFNVTPRPLVRRFLSATGLTPMQYLGKHRLEIARRLLQSTNLQIQQITEQAASPQQPLLAAASSAPLRRRHTPTGNRCPPPGSEPAPSNRRMHTGA